jgi:Uma2 family endonuclease
MYAVISAEKVHLPPGSVMRMPGNWQDYCVIRGSRGDSAMPHIKFRNHEILLMSPLPRHGREANILADIVKILLDSEARNYEAFTPITMEMPESGGIEPDYCFYINHWQTVVGKDRLNWQVDPPPDLVIEIDVTTYTAVDDYLPYRVPEVWVLKKSGLEIYRWQDSSYYQEPTSGFFPTVDLIVLVTQTLQVAAEQGTGIALQELRQRLSLG